MFFPLTIPFGCVMLYNVLKLKPGVTREDIELAIGEMCNVVKNTYGDDKGGFIGGQVFKFSGFVSEEGSFEAEKRAEDHVAILTYWRSFEQHEASHADHIFKARFDAVGKFCTDTYEIGYEMLWQGEPEEAPKPKTARKIKKSSKKTKRKSAKKAKRR
ncbi:MAG: hypothetical protein OEY27_00635 [Gammaproteobacteria bacterium]|nr:hypothetical protein [Gammaproteobacteria bacterium]